MLPTFLGIGAPKAGTTWLANALAAHPEICFAKEKEPHYFTYKYGGTPQSHYESLFEPTPRTKAAGEFSTGYLEDPRVPERVRADLPDVRLVAAFRNPVGQIYSHYWHLQRQNFHVWDPALGQLSFEEALDRFEGKLLRPAYYAAHLERWLEHFPRERFHLLLFDDLKADPEAVVASVYDFVGVDPEWSPSTVEQTGSEARAGTSPRSARAALWGARIYDGLNRYAYHPMKKAIGEERAAAIKDALRVRSLLERTFRKKGYPEMRPETRARLIERFEEPNRRLGEMLGRDLSHWNR